MLVEKLKSALAAGVEVKLIVDLSQARGKGNSSIEDLIQAGAQVPQHRNLQWNLQWKVAIFDGQILIHGSQNKAATSHGTALDLQKKLISW
ncbi:hypothetical protein PF005_g27612 [Phytophthora fragariae]|uniref:Phospholipase D-like domain-containing protein n=1 Tax=Phytophthora fragariae TaxID=53985 RepID=A0A6A3VR25_9STRA|nr:hypothetical protein PF005_g27612 [Phytophthora fragariae]KAE9177691.1 hypothetical protein PF002_g28273 [Phytophthora fragariae]KAE9285662.1 hypothetical protein PF008_g26861 [Phytophthora fragariae]